MILRVADWMDDADLSGFISDGLHQLEQYLGKVAEFQRRYPEAE